MRSPDFLARPIGLGNFKPACRQAGLSFEIGYAIEILKTHRYIFQYVLEYLTEYIYMSILIS